MNTARLQTDAGKAVGIVEKAASQIKTAFKFAGGGLIGAALANTVKQSIQFGDEIAKAATKAGLGSRAMSELAYAAKLADIDIGALSTALRKMQISLSEAGTGAKGPKLALDALGLSIGEIRDKAPDKQFEMLAQRISELKDPADRARAATELFGKAGADLLPLFEQGATGIRKAREEAEKLGLSFGDDTIKVLARADDAAKRLNVSWSGFAATMVSKVAPSLSYVMDLLSGADSRGRDEKIRALEARLSSFAGGGYVAPGSPLAAEKAAMEAELDRLRDEEKREWAAQTTIGGGSRGMGTRGSRAKGFGAASADEAAKEAQKKAIDAEEKAVAERYKLHEELFAEEMRIFEGNLEEQFDIYLQHEERQVEVAREKAEEIAKIHREEAEKRARETERLGELLDDQLMNAFKRGKEGWKDMLEYWVTQLAFSGINQLFGGLLGKGGKTLGGGLAEIFSGGGLGGGGGMGIAQGEWDWLGKIGGFGGGLFGSVGKIFGFANGGRPPLDRPSLVGERGPELFWPDGAGAVIPGGMGGNITIAPVYQIDAHGNTDLERALPRIFRENNAALEALIVTRLKKNHYGLR